VKQAVETKKSYRAIMASKVTPEEVSSCYERVFVDTCANLKRNVEKKIKDSNTMKSSLINPHYRTISLPNVHKVIFASTFGKLLKTEEQVCSSSRRHSPKFQIKTLSRLQKLISSESLFRQHPSGDISFVTPWSKFTEDTYLMFENNLGSQIETGRLVIPLTESEDDFKVFVTCPGLDDDDRIPDWVIDFYPNDIGLSIPSSQLREEKAVGTITLDRKLIDSTSICTGQNICEKDFIRVRSSFFQVRGIGPDPFKGNSNMIRFTTDFTKNMNNAPFYVIKRPLLKGNIATIKKSSIVAYNPVEVQVDKIDVVDAHGMLNVTFQNACFNVLGFMCHEVAV